MEFKSFLQTEGFFDFLGSKAPKGEVEVEVPNKEIRSIFSDGTSFSISLNKPYFPVGSPVNFKLDSLAGGTSWVSANASKTGIRNVSGTIVLDYSKEKDRDFRKLQQWFSETFGGVTGSIKNGSNARFPTVKLWIKYVPPQATPVNQ